MPSRQDPPLGLTDVVQRRAEQNIWHQLDFRSCWQVIMFTMNRLRGSSPDFCRVYSLAFPPPRYSTRQRAILQWPGHGCWNLRAFMDQGSLPSQSVHHPWTLRGCYLRLTPCPRGIACHGCRASSARVSK